MKYKITLLSFIFFMTLFSFGQRKGIKDNRYDEKSRVESHITKMKQGKNEYRKGNLFNKTRLVFQNSRVNSSKSISSPLVLKYGLDYEISQFWDETLGQWGIGYKIDYTYDTNGNLTQFIFYDWNGSEFVNEWKTDYTYDTNENLTQVIDYNWDISQWGIDYKIEYTYDTNGNLTQEIEYSWNGVQWGNQWKTDYTYDTNENLTQVIEYHWYGSEFENEYKTDYTYDTNGNLTQEIEYSWNGVQWDNEWKTDYTYDTNGNITQYIDVYWNGVQWGNEWKTEFTYNNSYSFSDLILPFFYSNTEVKIFFNHMLTNGKGYIWDETLSDWKIRDNIDFSYSEKDILSIPEIIEEQLKIYPNPVLNMLTIKSEIIPIDKVEIYSVLGKKIKEINLDFNNINTEDLSKSIYLLRIYTEKGTTVKKLIKK